MTFVNPTSRGRSQPDLSRGAIAGLRVMAALASRRCRFIDHHRGRTPYFLLLVAIAAGHHPMKTRQRKVRFFVVECGCPPGDLAVAAFAMGNAGNLELLQMHVFVALCAL